MASSENVTHFRTAALERTACRKKTDNWTPVPSEVTCKGCRKSIESQTQGSSRSVITTLELWILEIQTDMAPEPYMDQQRQKGVQELREQLAGKLYNRIDNLKDTIEQYREKLKTLHTLSDYDGGGLRTHAK